MSSKNRQARNAADRVVVRALVECAGRVLVIKRNKYGQEYTVLPGGGVEDGEEQETTAVRELLEETSVKADAIKQIVEVPHDVEKNFSRTHIWLCEYASGVPKVAEGSEEAAENIEGKNTYKPCWVSMEEAIETLVPVEVREYLRAQV